MRSVRSTSIVTTTLIVCAHILCLYTTASAATRTWDGGGANDNWSTVNNWDNNALPANTDDVVFGTAFTSGTSIDLIADRTVNSFTISTITGFSIDGGDNLTLTSGLFTRNNVAGTEANHTINAAITLGANGQFAINGDGTLTINGVIQDGASTFSFTKSGTGILVLTGGANTYNGDTIVDAGVLRLGVDNKIGDGAGIGNLVVNAAGTFDVGGFSDTINGFSGSGTVDKTTSGTTTLTVGGNNASATFSGTITDTTGTLNLVKTGTGTQTLSGTNSYAGSTTINGGTLALGASTNIGAGNLAFGGGVLAMTGTFNRALGTGAGQVQWNAGGGGFAAYGGALSVDIGDQTWDSGNFVEAGTPLIFGSAISDNVVTWVDGISLGGSGGGTMIREFQVIDNPSSSADYAVIAGVISSGNNKSLNKTGNGILALTNANSYDSTTISAGTLRIGDGGTTGSVANNITNNATLEFNRSNDFTHSGTISGTGLVIKNGAGELTLSGNNSYGGGTTINAGALSITNVNALGTGAVVVNAGTLEIANVALVANNLTLNNGATLRGTGANASYSKTNFPSVGNGAAVNLTTEASSDVLSINSAIRNGNSSSSITVGGPGTVVIGSGATSADAYAGSWNMNGASTTVLRLTDANALGNPSSAGGRPITLTNGTLQLRVSTGSTFTTATTVAGNVAITPDRGASGAANTHTMGTLSIGSNTLTVNHGVNYTANNTGSLTFGATTLTGNATFTLNNVNGTGIGVTTLGALNDGGTARTIGKGGSGTLTLGSAATSLVDGTAVNATAGTLSLNNATALGTLANVTLSTGATLSLSASHTLGALNSASGNTGSVTLGANTLTIGSTNNLNSSFAGEISGTGAVVKEGTGSATLSGSNTYSGATTVNAGTLVAASNDALGNTTGSTTVTSGATLSFQGSINYSSAEAVNITGTGVGGVGAINNISGTNTFAGAITLTADSSVGVAADALTLSNTIAGGFNLAKIGAGTLTLSGANTYGGSTTINAGTLQLGASNVIPNGSAVSLANTAGANLNVNNQTETIASLSGGGTSGGNVQLGSGTLTTGDATNTTYAGILSGATGNLVKQGAGTMTLTGANTYGGTTTVNAGTLDVGSTSALGTTAGSTTVASGATLSFQGSINYASNELVSIAGTGVGGNGAILSVSGTNTFGGAITMTANSSIGVAADTLTLTNAIAGGFDLTKLGAGVLTLSGANTYGGSTTINAGTLTLGASGVIPNGSAVILANTAGANLNVNNQTETIGSLSGGGASGGNVPLGSGTLITGNATNTTYSGVISGATGNLVKQGAGSMTLSGANTYGGTTTVNAGTLRLGASGVVPNGSAVSLANTAGANLDVNNQTETIGSLSGGGATGGDVQLGSGTLTTGDSSNTTYAGVISGTGGSLVKQGSGAMTLTNANTYTGGTTINGGTLFANNTTGSATGSGAVTVNNGGTLAGTGAVTGDVTVNGGGTLSPGTSIETLSVGALTFSADGNGGSTFAAELNTNVALSVAADLVNANGNLSIVAGAILSLVDLGNTQLTGGTKLTLISYDGSWDNGIFVGHADDSLLSVGVNTFVINYDDTLLGANFGGGLYGNSVTLTAVPEATAFVFGGFVCVMLAALHVGRKLRRHPAAD